jgi:hypothetical protein
LRIWRTPFTPAIQTPNWSRSGNISTNAEDRPNVKPGTDPRKIITGDPNHWFDTSVFELQPRGTFGNTPRNFLRSPGFANVDMSLVKNQPLAGTTRLQLRLEVFNVLNRANFATPTRPVFAGAAQNEAPLATYSVSTGQTRTTWWIPSGQTGSVASASTLATYLDVHRYFFGRDAGGTRLFSR